MARVGKIDLIEEIAQKTGYAKKDVTTFFDAFTAAVESNMQVGNDIVIPGFGSWKVQDVKERVGRNMQTGEAITIPAKKRVKFTAGSKLKDAAASKKINLKKSGKKTSKKK